MVLLWRQQFQRLLLGNLDVHAHAVGIAASLVEQFLRTARDALQVDVTIKAMHRPEVARNSCQPLHGVVGIAHHATRQEEPFDVVATIELHRDFLQLADRKRCSLDIVRAAIDAVGAVVHAVVGQHHLQQRDAAAVVGKRMADTHATHRRAHHTLLSFAHGTARRARHIVLRRLCEYPQLFHCLFCQHNGAKVQHGCPKSRDTFNYLTFFIIHTFPKYTYLMPSSSAMCLAAFSVAMGVGGTSCIL